MRETKWRIAGREIDLTSRGRLMGVLNVTPDSFSDGGEFFDADRAVAHGLRLAAEGADFIDVGGESTRPGAEEISAAEECARVLPVIEKLHQQTETLLSIDTSKLEVARLALEAGASIINDVTGGRRDPGLFALAAEREAGFIIMHMQGNPRTMQIAPHYEDVVAEVADFFRQQFERAIKCGIDPMAIAFDPGIGFGKTLSHNLALLRHLDRLVVNDRPLVVGVSRKGFLGKIVNAEAITDRLAPTVALTALLRERGAHVLRVHDIKENRAALRTTEALLTAEK